MPLVPGGLAAFVAPPVIVESPETRKLPLLDSAPFNVPLMTAVALLVRSPFSVPPRPRFPPVSLITSEVTVSSIRTLPELLIVSASTSPLKVRSPSPEMVIVPPAASTSVSRYRLASVATEKLSTSAPRDRSPPVSVYWPLSTRKPPTERSP